MAPGLTLGSRNRADQIVVMAGFESVSPVVCGQFVLQCITSGQLNKHIDAM